jgi:hypothetical protein
MLWCQKKRFFEDDNALGNKSVVGEGFFDKFAACKTIKEFIFEYTQS